MSGPVPRLGNIGYCEDCRRIVMVFDLATGGLRVIDPDYLQRRAIRSVLGPEAVMLWGFGPGIGTDHQCYPDRSKAESRGLYGGDHLEN